MMGMWTAQSDLDYASWAMQDAYDDDERCPACGFERCLCGDGDEYDEDDEADQQLNIEREERHE